MVKVAICDDEVTTLEQMRVLLEEYPLALQVDAFLCGEELVAAKESYEIIFLDVDMAGMNGIETAHEIRKKDKKVKIIYVTNYSDYTTFAFAVHAFAYLLKPVDKTALYRQLEEAFLYMQLPQAEKLSFDTKEGIIRIETSELLYLEYVERKVMLHTREETYTMKRRITDLARELEQYDFFMPHKSFVVNLYAVKRIVGYDIYLTDDARIPLSQKKSVAFRRALNQYLAKRGGRNL